MYLRLCILALLFVSTLLQAEELATLTLIERPQNRELPQYSANNQRYVPGEVKQRYAVRLSNRTGERLLVILSVDGVNAISGQTASPSQSGYVLDPYEQVDIAGWRKSDRDVAQFYFTALPDSYAARTHRPDNVGIIGIAVFQEKRRPPPPVPQYLEEHSSRGSGLDAAAAAPQKRETRLGTGHGEREYAPVTHTQFERASTEPAQISTIRYDTRQHLIDQGIIPAPREPQAFPNQYVPDPPPRRH